MEIPRRRSLYDVLCIDPEATNDEVRKAYKHKALETHPDKLDPGASEEQKYEAEARFREVKSLLSTSGLSDILQVHEAFLVLSDHHQRQAYDIRSRIRAPGWRTTSEEQLARMRGREEWARRREEEHQLRMSELREQGRIIREQTAIRVREAKAQAAMVQQMLAELCDLPEWEARLTAVHQRRQTVPESPLSSPSS
ncbi:hypothetical protein C8J56DRAFT_1061608 [Mycena floridula]|nr:hypothetical protein C8J56DRAFT_1061608 [Mycena floridula]